ncbi:MAG: alpha/beta fold hydrolase, partial [Proteobacteria bacterium]|nr:alpha/beta fold hydrolase [Pseudomonadota bacterium]
MKTLRGLLEVSLIMLCSVISINSQRYLVLMIFPFMSCQTTNPALERRTVNDIHLRLSLLPEGIDRYREDGPFNYQEDADVEMPISADERRQVDIYRTKGAGLAPIILISHGNFSGKRAHRNQARRLASWGFHVVVVELPNRDQWLENGRRMFEVAGFLTKWPKFLGDNVDGSRIILAGHSFGGSAVTLAAGFGAPVSGLILLDPAVAHPSVTAAMGRIDSPVVLLGSDVRMFSARGRKKFRKNIVAEFLELTVRGATHDDAQGPSMFSRYSLGLDPFTNNESRAVFTASFVSAAISISSSGNLEQLRKDLASSANIGKVGGIIFRR